MLSHLLACLGVLAIGAGLLLRSEQRSREVVIPTKEAYRLIVAGHPEAETEALWTSVEGLRAAEPDMAIDRTLSRRQQEALIIGATVAAFSIAISWNLTLIVLLGLVIALYSASLVVRLALFRTALNGHGMVRVNDEAARSVPDRALPTYTVLVPAYGEPEVVGRLLDHLRALDYPRDKLETLLLLEADDAPTIEAARRTLAGSDDVTVVLVPDAGPRTKPKALNYGLMRSHGAIVTIFDAEDRPEPLQLRKAALALALAPPDIACVQARLDFYNPTQNLLTKWFTLDYRMWFTQLLPGLSQMGAPIPLGGTSNHFRRDVLIEVGAWDPFNVTEDADLGVRLHRKGYRTGVLDSITLEEANSDTVNWVKQRSRWYKGYAQTALVHLRHPVQLRAELGTRAFLLFILFVGGTPLLAMLNPLFWALTIVWWTFHPHWLHSIIPALSFFLGQLCWVAGNAAVLYSWMLTTRRPGERLWQAALLSPLYWVLMSIAATKAIVQLVIAPSYWEKTQHGLDQVEAAGAVA